MKTVAADVSPLHFMQRIPKNEPAHAGCHDKRAAQRGVSAIFLFVAAALVSTAMETRAQQTPGGFTSVEYFAQPNQTHMKSRLSGTEAQPLPGGLLVIKQLKLETFATNGSPQAVVEAPECVYDTLHSTANSAGHLRLRSGNGKIRTEGDGFLWRQDDSFLTISNHVHTVFETGPEMNIGL
jgi:hypothetical protein